ncbi:MAG: hypothetical protein LBI55_03860 [Oscillospiraceae bacterium]|nr:hypothetical protein [Oscillospiraceae bacterium]
MNKTLKKCLAIGALLTLGTSPINFSNNFDEITVSAVNAVRVKKIRTDKYGNDIYKITPPNKPSYFSINLAIYKKGRNETKRYVQIILAKRFSRNRNYEAWVQNEKKIPVRLFDIKIPEGDINKVNLGRLYQQMLVLQKNGNDIKVDRHTSIRRKIAGRRQKPGYRAHTKVGQHNPLRRRK